MAGAVDFYHDFFDEQDQYKTFPRGYFNAKKSTWNSISRDYVSKLFLLSLAVHKAHRQSTCRPMKKFRRVDKCMTSFPIENI